MKNQHLCQYFMFVFSLTFVLNLNLAHAELNFEITGAANGEKKLILTKDGVQLGSACPLELLKKDTFLFHWGSAQRELKYGKTGRLNQEQVDALMRIDGSSGGGLYVSTDPWDSSGYGTHLLIVKASQDGWILPWDVECFSPNMQRNFYEEWYKKPHPEGDSSSLEISRILRNLGIAGALKGSNHLYTFESEGDFHYLSLYDEKILQNVRLAVYDDFVRFFNDDSYHNWSKDKIGNMLFYLAKISEFGKPILQQLDSRISKFTAAERALITKLILQAELAPEDKSPLKDPDSWRALRLLYLNGRQRQATPTEFNLHLAKNLFRPAQQLGFVFRSYGLDNPDLKMDYSSLSKALPVLAPFFEMKPLDRGVRTQLEADLEMKDDEMSRILLDHVQAITESQPVKLHPMVQYLQNLLN